MEPTLITPNPTGFENTSMPAQPVAPRQKPIIGRIIWMAFALIVVIFLVIYFVTKEKRNAGLTEAEKMQVLDYLENESEPVIVEETTQNSVIESLQDRVNSKQ